MKLFFISGRKAKIILVGILLGLIVFYCFQKKTYNEKQVVILGYSELGMHCIQPDYSQFLILPPGNNIRVQVFRKGDKPELLMDGIKVKYKINSQDDPAKYTNFWVYAQNTVTTSRPV